MIKKLVFCIINALCICALRANSDDGGAAERAKVLENFIQSQLKDAKTSKEAIARLMETNQTLAAGLAGASSFSPEKLAETLLTCQAKVQDAANGNVSGGTTQGQAVTAVPQMVVGGLPITTIPQQVLNGATPQILANGVPQMVAVPQSLATPMVAMPQSVATPQMVAGSVPQTTTPVQQPMFAMMTPQGTVTQGVMGVPQQPMIGGVSYAMPQGGVPGIQSPNNSPTIDSSKKQTQQSNLPSINISVAEGNAKADSRGSSQDQDNDETDDKDESDDKDGEDDKDGTDKKDEADDDKGKTNAKDNSKATHKAKK